MRWDVVSLKRNQKKKKKPRLFKVQSLYKERQHAKEIKSDKKKQKQQSGENKWTVQPSMAQSHFSFLPLTLGTESQGAVTA